MDEEMKTEMQRVVGILQEEIEEREEELNERIESRDWFLTQLRIKNDKRKQNMQEV